MQTQFMQSQQPNKTLNHCALWFIHQASAVWIFTVVFFLNIPHHCKFLEFHSLQVFLSQQEFLPTKDFCPTSCPFEIFNLRCFESSTLSFQKSTYLFGVQLVSKGWPHFVSHRKICKLCKCSQEDHSLSSDAEDDRKIGRLLSDSKYSSLTARVKGGDGVRIYKRNRMIITNPIVSRKDPTFDTVTYEWAPPGLTQKLVRSLV